MGKFPRKVEGYTCPECEEFIKTMDECTEVEVYEKDDFDDDRFIKVNDVDGMVSKTVKECPHCDALLEDYDFDHAIRYECFECEELHDERYDAQTCCD